jgi:UDP-galactopyranose mutase
VLDFTLAPKKKGRASRARGLLESQCVVAQIGERRLPSTPGYSEPTRAGRSVNLQTNPDPTMKTIVIFSHLRWNFVYQRPQHLLSRMASRWRIVFIEEPMPNAEQPGMERLAAAPGVEVWRPHVTGEHSGFHDDHIPELQRLVAESMRQEKVTDYWLWFYTPMALPLAAELKPRGVVYDCMDELTNFKNAPRQLVQRENALFKLADLVFTGGPSLYEHKRNRHPSVHCFASSVDAAHFARIGDDHPAQAAIASPRLGYCGVIDERIDMDIVAGLAQARPDWQIVMVGPVVKIDPGSLPRHPNIHWLGQQSYQDLPAFISGWDICLLPFAINDATRYISPTKILEYMACSRPSVSTPIKDVVDPYGHVVPIATDAQGFVAACDAILARTDEERDAHAQALGEVVARTSWDATANAMAELIVEADKRSHGGHAVLPQPPESFPRDGAAPRVVRTVAAPSAAEEPRVRAAG